MKIKDCMGFKLASGQDGAGQFEAIVSVFNVVDRDGDAVLPGAFQETLDHWKTAGDPMPVYWSHRMDDPRFLIGRIIESSELYAGDSRMPEWVPDPVRTNGGLWVRGQLDVGPEASDIALATRRLLVARLVKQFSYAYTVQDGQWITVNGADAYGLKRLDLHEVSVTQVGSNELTQLIAAKSQLDEAAAQQPGKPTPPQMSPAESSGEPKDDGKPEGEAAKDDEPDPAKSEERAPALDAATVRLLSEGQRLLLDV